MFGDCSKRLREIPDNFFDSLCCDPPAGISFMGKSWDGDKGGRDQWISWMAQVMKEALRTLKPGAHGLVWALPRTSHWTATALENAGFEIRDIVTHLFGTGFPKSLNISKAIDKAAGVEREVIGESDRYRDGKKRTKGAPKGNMLGNNSNGVSDITAPATEAAKQWDGWGTALKPASEHWILVRKPLSEKTVAANVLKWGTGGINIDECRIEASNRRSPLGADGMAHRTTGNSYGKHKPSKSDFQPDQGRFPANLVLSGDAPAMLDEQSGGSNSSDRPRNNGDFKSPSKGYEKAHTTYGYTYSGGASRFFYCPKASKSDRGEGNKHPTVKSTKLMEYLLTLVTPSGGTVLDPFMGSGSTGVAGKRKKFRFVGIEFEKETFRTAKKRLGHKQKKSKVRLRK